MGNPIAIFTVRVHRISKGTQAVFMIVTPSEEGCVCRRRVFVYRLEEEKVEKIPLGTHKKEQDLRENMIDLCEA